MATPIELEHLIVRMSADVENLLQGMQTTGMSVTQMAETVNNSTKAIDLSLGNLKASFGAIAAVWASASFLRQGLHAWEDQENAVIDLESSLRANGREVDVLSTRYQDFATEMQKTTTIADEVTVSMLNMAEGFQLTGGQAEKAVEDAIALAGGNAALAQSYLRVTAAVSSGDMERAMLFSRMIPRLRGIKDEAEFMDKYSKGVEAGAEAARKKAMTAGGQLSQLANDWGDFMEIIGSKVSEASGLKEVTTLLKDFSKWLQTLPPGIAETTVRLLIFSAAVKALSVALPLLKAGLLALAANPVAWAVVATAALVALAVEMSKDEEAANRLDAAIKNLKKSTEEWTGVIKSTGEQKILNADDNIKELEKVQKWAKDNLEKSKAGTPELSWTAKYVRAPMHEIASTVSFGALEDESLKSARAIIASSKDETAQWEKILKEVSDKIKNIGDDTSRAGALTQMDNIIRAYEKQNRELGKSPEQIKLARIQWSLTYEEIMKVYEAQNKLEKSTKEAAAKKGIFSMLESLMEERIKVRGKGDPFFNAELDKLIRQLPVAGGHLATFVREYARQTEILSQAAAVKEDIMTPVEKFNKEEDRLRKMLDAGALTWEEYTKAVDKAAAAMDGAASSARDAATAGSAEGMARIRDFVSDRPRFGANRPGGPVGQAAEKGPMPREVKPFDINAIPSVPEGKVVSLLGGGGVLAKTLIEIRDILNEQVPIEIKPANLEP